MSREQYVKLSPENFDALTATAVIGASSREENARLREEVKQIPQLQDNIKKLTNDNKKLTRENNNMKKVLDDPSVKRAIFFLENPHIAYAITERSKAMTEADIAYNLIKHRKEPSIRVVQALNFERSTSTTDSALNTIADANKRIDQERAAIQQQQEQAKIVAEQTRVRAEQLQHLTKRLDFINRHKSIKAYLLLSEKYKDDHHIIKLMFASNFNKQEIIYAIDNESKSPDRPKNSNTNVNKNWAKNLVNQAEKSISTTIKTNSTTKSTSSGGGGGMIMGGGRDRGGLLRGLLESLSLNDSKVCALIARSAPDDLSCLEGEALMQAIKKLMDD
jgi:regulator of replication initiation timing